LLLIVSTHSSWINQINTKSCDTHQTMSFSAACLAPEGEFFQADPLLFSVSRRGDAPHF